MTSVIDQARAARQAALVLANVPEATRNAALETMAAGIEAAADGLLEVNAREVTEGEKLVESGELAAPLLKRLILTEKKVEGIVEGVRSVRGLADPVGRTMLARELSPGLELYQVTVPIGVLGIVFESRPDVVPQVASLCLKSGNAVIMKGGREATETNRFLAKTIVDAVAAVDGIPDGWLHLIETREEVADVLKLPEYIDLVIPRGSNAFVQHVMHNTDIPVLGHADGICHVYVDRAADVDMAVAIAVDAKTQYPAVCNAAETLLVHADVAARFLPAVAKALGEHAVRLRADDRSRAVLEGYPLLEAADESDWSAEYLDLVLAVKVVDGLREAIDHINTYGSHHTDAIVTADAAAADAFLAGVDSASVMHNASTRFADGFRYGHGAEIGIGAGKIHSRGPVGLEGLVIYKYLVKGAGQTVTTHTDGGGSIAYTHKALNKRV